MGIHDGHRSRMKKRFLEHGLDNFEDHELLELLLYYTIPQRDVNPLAHQLLTHFGTLSAVFDAPSRELMIAGGLTESAAVLIKLMPEIARRYQTCRSSFDNILNSTEKTGNFIVPYFFGQRDELVYMVCLDAKFKVLSCKCMFRGSVNTAVLSIRKLIEQALIYNATAVVIAHNHPSGIALPSQEDLETTARVHVALRSVDIELLDHIVVADDDFVSIAENGFFRNIGR